MLAQLCARIRPARVDEWWLTTTSDPADDVTEAWGFELGLRVFRGDRTDVLSRFLTIGAEAWAAFEDPDIEVLQVASSLLDLRLYRQGFFPRARELGRTIYVRGVFLQGVGHLAPETLPPALVDLVEPMRIIATYAQRLNVPARALYLAFAREIPGAHPVVGCETDAQLAKLLADWASEAIDSAAISQLVEALPTLESDAIDPSTWGEAEIGRSKVRNQTETTSIATIGI